MNTVPITPVDAWLFVSTARMKTIASEASGLIGNPFREHGGNGRGAAGGNRPASAFLRWVWWLVSFFSLTPAGFGPKADSRSRGSLEFCERIGVRGATASTVMDSHERGIVECNAGSLPLLATLVAILLATIFASTAFAQIPAKRYNPDFASSNPYGLVDLDNFAAGSYGYCKWGNLQDSTTFNQATLRFSSLTYGNNQQELETDLFLTRNLETIQIVPFGNLVSRSWTPSIGTADGNVQIRQYDGLTGSFPPIYLLRKLHFRNILDTKWLSDPIPADTKKVIVLIHGWNRTGESYEYDDEFDELYNSLKIRTTGTDWKLVLYHWEQDADTGGFQLDPPFRPDQKNPTEAAEIAHLHGQHLGELLAKWGQIQKVHFIAHSAGTWAARSAAKYLLQKTDVQVQITLLDPFMPSVMGTNNTSLQKSLIDGIPSLDSAGSSHLIFLENYYAVDDNPIIIFGAKDGWDGGSDYVYKATSQRFSWGSRGVNQQVDWNPPGTGPGTYYKWHSGPIQFYARTVVYSDTTTVGDDLNNPAFDLPNLGWRRSMLFREPRFMLQPQDTSAKIGDTVPLSVIVVQRGLPLPTPAGLTLQWQVKTPTGDWTNTSNGSSTLQIAKATAAMNGTQYRVVATLNGLSETSQTAVLTVSGTAKPSPFTITAAAQTPNGVPTIVVRIATPSDPGVTYVIHRDGAMFNLPGLEFSNTTITSGTTYHYFVRATNSAGLSTDSNTVPVIAPNPSAPPNTTAPALPIGLTVNPASWSRLNQFSVSWTNPPHASNIVKVWYWIGSAPPGNGQGTSLSLPQGNPLLVSLPMQEGSSVIYVWLQDDKGNVSRSNYASATLKLDTTRPTIAITPPASIVNGQSSINLSGTFADNLSGVASVAWLTSIGNHGNATTSGAGLSGTWSAGPISLSSGVNTITVTATDAAGNVGTASIAITALNASNSGNVQVTIAPQGAISAGAQWRFAGEVFWHNTGDLVNSYTGTRLINFSPADGWTAPPDNYVTVVAGQTTTLAGTYTVPLSGQKPYAPSLPYPADGTGNVARNSLGLQWLGGSPNGTVTYALAMGTNPNVSISDTPLVAIAGYGGTSGSSFQVPATLQPATTYYWRVYTQDHFGNVTIGPVWRFTTQYAIPDLVPGDLSIEGNITPGSTVTTRVTVTNQGSFTAQGAYVNLYLSRSPGAKEAQLNPFHSLYLPAALAPGQSVTLSAQVTLTNLPTGQSFLDAWIDSAPWGASAESNYNNNTTSLALSYIDGTPPTVSYFAPQNTFPKTGASMTFVVQASDDDRISTLDFYYSIDGGTTWTPIQEGYVPPTSPANGITYSWTVPTTLPSGGNLMLRVVATDPAGNSGEKIVGPYVIHDGTAPVVKVIFPNGGEALPAGSTQQLRWSMSAPNGVQYATLSLYYTNNSVTTQDITTNTTGSYSWTLPAQVTSNVAKIRVTLRDQNGNSSEDWSDAPFAIVDNSQPPSAPWTAATAVTSVATGDPAGSPRIVADSTGTLHLIYGLAHDATAHTISFRYRKRAGTTWTTPTVVSFNVTNLDSQIGSSYSIGSWRFAVDSNGRPHLAWATSHDFTSEQSKNDVFYTSFDGTSWATPQNISSNVRSPVTATSMAWARKADTPFASSTSAAVAVGGKLYFVYYEQMYQYDPVANSWTRKADAPSTAVNDGGATVVNNLIYAAGGSDGTVRIYNPVANSWSTRAVMPAPQQGVRLAAAANGMVYAMGGDTGAFAGGTKARMYDPGANSWTLLQDMPTARSHPAVAAVGTKVYVIGGYPQQQSMDIYDTVGNTWTTKPYPIAANIPPSFGGFAVVANDKIYFLPGMPTSGISASRDVWEYDPATGGWTRMQSTQFGHGFACGTAIGSKLYVLGGVDGSNAVSSMEEASLSADFAGTVSSSPQVVVDAANAVHVLWNDGRYLQPDGSAFSSFSSAGESNVYEAVRSGASWSSPVQVTAGGVNRHAVVADQSGNLHLGYQNTNNDIAYSRSIGGSWSAPVFAGVALSGYGLDIAVDATMKVHVLYSGFDPQTSLNNLNYITLTGTAWSSLERVSLIQTGVPPRLCLDALNRPHAIWEGGSLNPQVLYSTKNGAGWVAPIQLNRASEPPAYGSVDAALRLGSSELNVVWLGANSGNPNVLLNYANVGSAIDIYPPAVAINGPGPGDILSIGNQATITWTATDNVGVTAVDLSYSTDGTTWTPIATNIANTGSRQWTVPNVATVQVRVTARDAAGNSGFAISGVLSPSSTIPPTVTVTSPVASASLTARSTVAVQWTATANMGVAKIDLEYSSDNGYAWLPIASGLNNTGSYSWPVPNTVTSGLLIRVTAHDNSGLTTAALSQPARIVASNTPPVAPNSPFPLDSAANVGVTSTMLQWSSGDADGDPLTYTIRLGTDATSWQTFSTSTASYAPISLQPTTNYVWQVVASDGTVTSQSPVWSFSTQADTRPTINSALAATGVHGTAFASYAITATNSPISYNATNLPLGLSVNPGTGIISGTPTQIGTFNVTLSATNADGTGTATLMLTVAPRDYTGTYFGTFASGGNWALAVRRDSTATYIAYLPSRHSAIIVSLTVGLDGTFTVTGTEIKPLSSGAVSGYALGNPEAPVTRTAAAGSSYTLSGTIAADGGITGGLTGLGETFTGAAAASTGAAQTSAGLYTASALGTASGTTYAIVGASGQALIVTTTPTGVDGATGTVNASGALTATTSNNAALTVTINPSAQSLSASVTPSGSSTPVTYGGVASTVTPIARVVNLSVRTPAGTGDQTLIVGLVITGSGNKTLLLRGIGPTLSTQNVSNPLADPTMRLLNNSGAEISANNDWGGSSQMSANFAAVGAFALQANSKDAALFNTLSTGLYSFHTYPNGAGTGIVLAEVYDADDDTSTASVFNISARTQVGTGENILIAGFVITGNSPKTLLIRGLGPTLAAQGVTGALVNPQLYLFGSAGLVASNDDWGGTTALKNSFAVTGAGSLASDTSKDAALLVTLQPGVYSAQVSGVGSTTGVGLVEIFLVP